MNENKITILLVVFISLSILFMSIGYAALNTELSISGETYVRVKEEIRITDIKMVSAESGAYETYNSKYSKDTTSMFVTMLNSNSTITYEVTIENKSAQQYKLKDILEESTTNSNITYQINGVEIDTIFEGNTTTTFSITFTTRIENQKMEWLLKYEFEKYYFACNIDLNTTWEFAYTGGEQNFTVPCHGTYQVEVWGAQGYSVQQFIGGYGGYSLGNILLNKGENLYVYVGQGANCNSTAIGSGGGGSGYIGNPLLFNKSMHCYQCLGSVQESIKTFSTINVSETPISYYAKQGNGYVKITLILVE